MLLVIVWEDVMLLLFVIMFLNWWKWSFSVSVWCFILEKLNFERCIVMKCELGCGWGWRNRNFGVKKSGVFRVGNKFVSILLNG